MSTRAMIVGPTVTLIIENGLGASWHINTDLTKARIINREGDIKVFINEIEVFSREDIISKLSIASNSLVGNFNIRMTRENIIIIPQSEEVSEVLNCRGKQVYLLEF